MKLRLLLLFLALPLLAQERDTPAPQQADQRDPAAVRLRFRPYLSVRVGDVLRMDFHLKFQGDFRGLEPSLKSGENLFDLHRVRVGIEGRFLRDFEYEVEREIREEVSGGEFENPRHPWRDAFVNYRHFRDFQIRGGKFKLPFSREQLTGPTRLDFIFRSRIADNIAPARDLGIVAHGNFSNRSLTYEAGLFKQDGENGRTIASGLEYPAGQRTFAGRLTGMPLRLLSGPGFWKRVEVGGAFALSTVPGAVGPEGAKGLRGRTVDGHVFFPHLFVRGQRLRIGAEMTWAPGPFSLNGEFVHARDERRGQGLRGVDLPPLIARGWYVSGTWVVTGERKRGGVEPRKNFLLGRGTGAAELAVRYEQLRFGSSEHPGIPSRATRAANILGNSDRVWTFGANWYWNRLVKIQFNAIRERLEDTALPRSPIEGTSLYWMRVVRLQLIL